MASDRATETVALNFDYWWSALGHAVEAMWGTVDWVDTDEKKHVAQVLAMMAYLESETTDIEARVSVQDAYMAGVFSEKTRKRYRRSMSTTSNLQKVLRNVCTLYNRPPERVFTDDSATNDAFAKLYRTMKADVRLQKAYKIARLTNHVALRPRFRSDGRMTCQILTPATYRLRPKEDYDDEVGEMWVPYMTAPTWQNGAPNRERRFRVWSADYVYEADYRGRPITESGSIVDLAGAIRENPYGRIPYTFLRLSDPVSGSLYGAGLWDLVGLQVWNNVAKLVSDRNFLFTSFAILLAINMKWADETRDMSPGNVLAFEGIYDNSNLEGAMVPPHMESVDQPSSFLDGDEFRMERVREYLRDMGLPSYYFDDTGQPPSGEALKVQERELKRITDEDRLPLAEAEADLASLTAIVHNVDRWDDVETENGLESVRTPLPAAKALPTDLPQFAIDYAEEPYYIKPDDEYGLAQKKLKDGLIEARKFYRTFSGNDAPVTNEEAIERMKKARELVSSLGENDLGQDQAIRDQALYAIGWRPTLEYLTKTYSFDSTQIKLLESASILETVGGITTATEIVKSYEAGEISREGAVGLAVYVLKMEKSEAEELFSEQPEAAGTEQAPPPELVDE